MADFPSTACSQTFFWLKKKKNMKNILTYKKYSDGNISIVTLDFTSSTEKKLNETVFVFYF